MVVLGLIVFITVIVRQFIKFQDRWTAVCHSLLKSSQSSLEEIIAEIWISDRDCNADKLWTDLRDVANFPVGPKSRE